MKNLYPGDYRTANSIDPHITPMDVAAGMGVVLERLVVVLIFYWECQGRWSQEHDGDMILHKTEQRESKNCFLSAILILSESHLRLRIPEPLAYKRLENANAALDIPPIESNVNPIAFPSCI